MSLTRICPPAAAAQSRDDSTTGVPNQSPSSKLASPALIPTRIASRPSPSLRLWRSTARCIVAAPVSASAAPGYDTIKRVADRLHLGAAGRRDRLTQGGEVVAAHLVGRDVAQVGGELGRAHEIREQDRDQT